MTRMLSIQEKYFTPLAAWLRDELPSVSTTKPNVWEAFLAASRLAESDAKAAVRWGTDPFVFVEDLSGVYGTFDPSHPRTIRLAKDIVTAFKPRAEASVHQRIEATVLHEMVHWAWAYAGRAEPDEMGRVFEKAAYARTEVVEHAVPVEPEPEELGTLSRRYESRGNPGAIGRDTNGGWSYGLYQLSSAQGTLGRFIAFLAARPEYRAMAEAIEAAGGEAAGVSGAQLFQSSWKQLAVDPDFSRAQHLFTRVTHYDPYVISLAKGGIAVGPPRSKVVRDVAWSVSVQHGPGRTEIFTRPWAALSPAARADDALLINAVYHERSRVDVYFRRSSDSERTAVLDRFRRERADALAMLQNA